MALNIVDNSSLAVIKGSTTTVDAGGGDVTLTAENTSSNTATAKADATGGTIGVGASVALNIAANNASRAEVEDTVVLVNAKDLTLSASGDHAMVTTASAGSAGSVSVSPSIALSVAVN